MSTSTAEQRRRELLAERERINQELAALDALTQPAGGTPALDTLLEQVEPSQPAEPEHKDGRRAGGRPVRGIILDLLDDLGVATYTRELMHFARAAHGLRIPADRFGSIRQKERDAYDASRGRTVFIGCALTHRGESVKRLLIRSDWDLVDRVVAPTTGRHQFLKVTARLVDIAIDRRETIADWDAFRILVGDHVRDVPGLSFQRESWTPEAWRDALAAMLPAIAERDAQARAQIALRLQNTMPERNLIFGTEERVDPEPRLVAPIRAEHFV
jgi:hypothetical protein